MFRHTFLPMFDLAFVSHVVVWVRHEVSGACNVTGLFCFVTGMVVKCLSAISVH